MTPHERAHLLLIRAVLIKWTTGRHKPQRYTPDQRRDDLARIAEIDRKLSENSV